MTHGTVTWLQVGTDDPEGAKRFYGEMFGWTFATDPNSGGKYELATHPDAAQPHGGILHTDGEVPNHAIFCVTVSDVAAAAEKAEQLGAKIVVPPTKSPTGPEFAQFLDPSGNHIGVFSPPA
jgi:predicted enzyme related to lactoylglutathione lyase